jgi:hypothetical protein
MLSSGWHGTLRNALTDLRFGWVSRQVGSFQFPDSWSEIRDLGAALERGEPLPHPASNQVE